MITSETPYKLVEILHDTWPQLFRPSCYSKHKTTVNSKNKTTEELFEEWFTSNASDYTFIAEQFYDDCELSDLELRKKLLKGWLLCAFKEGRANH